MKKLALLDIAPLEEGLGEGDLQRVGRAKFMSFEAPRPEDLIALDAKAFLFDALKGGTKSGKLNPFADALDAYAQAFDEPSRIHAACEDFRAGEGPDKEALLADKAAGKKLIVPTLVLWGAVHAAEQPSLLDVWRDWAEDLSGEPIDCGHYPAEEAPGLVLPALEAFLA